MKKKILMIVTAMVLAIAMMPTLVFADDGDITVKVTIKNDSFASTLLNDAGKRITPAWTGALLDNYEVSLPEFGTATDAIEMACGDHEIAFFNDKSGGSSYFKNFDGVKNGQGILTGSKWGVFDMSGWQFRVNGATPRLGDVYYGTDDMVNDVGADASKKLVDGDAITLVYSVDGVTTDQAFTQGVKLNKTKVTLAKGKTVKLEAAIEPANGAVAVEGATWTTSDKTVATVDKAGKVAAKAAGIATIAATAKNTLSANCKVTIKPDKTTIKKLTAKKKAITVKWKKQSDATGYKIYRATKEKGKYKVVKTIKKNTTVKWTNKKLKSGKKYFYKIKVYKTSKGGKVYSTFSNIKSVKAK